MPCGCSPAPPCRWRRCSTTTSASSATSSAGTPLRESRAGTSSSWTCWGCPGCWSARRADCSSSRRSSSSFRVGLAQRLRTPSSRGLAIALSLAVVAQLLLYSQADWRAGVSWGPRWLDRPAADPDLDARARAGRPAPARTRRARRDDGGVGRRPGDRRLLVHEDERRAHLRAATPPRCAPRGIRATRRSSSNCGIRPRPASCSAAPAARSIGSDATVLRRRRGRPRLQPGRGRSKDGRSPAGARPRRRSLLIDGTVVGATETFIPRPDVDERCAPLAARAGASPPTPAGLPRASTCSSSPCGVDRRSDIRILREQPVTVASPPPTPGPRAGRARGAAAARRPERRGLLAHLVHDEPAVRSSAEGDEHVPDVDARRPARAGRTQAGPRRCGGACPAASRGADREQRTGALPRAAGRARPSARWDARSRRTPTTRRWRGGSPGRARTTRGRERMLRTLARYRDARGLYRTWLAPREQYQCLDPGRDPNPADIAIQMHVYLMLRELDPPAAQTPLHGDPALGGRRRRLGLLREGAAGALSPQRGTASELGCATAAPDGAAGATRPGTGALERGWRVGSWRRPRRGRTRTRDGRSATCSRASAATTSPCFAGRRRCSTTTI